MLFLNLTGVVYLPDFLYVVLPHDNLLALQNYQIVEEEILYQHCVHVSLDFRAYAERTFELFLFEFGFASRIQLI